MMMMKGRMAVVKRGKNKRADKYKMERFLKERPDKGEAERGHNTHGLA